MNYLIDTNILVHFVRKSPIYDKIDNRYDLFSPQNLTNISEVSIGEIQALAKRNRWGERKMERLELILDKALPVFISTEGIYEAYADIDAYSQSNHPTLSLPQGMTARNMGKNDLWIAATAYVLRATLVTTDKDFDHLQRFFDLEWVEQ